MYDIATAIDVLSLKSFHRLPKIIQVKRKYDGFIHLNYIVLINFSEKDFAQKTAG